MVRCSRTFGAAVGARLKATRAGRAGAYHTPCFMTAATGSAIVGSWGNVGGRFVAGHSVQFVLILVAECDQLEQVSLGESGEVLPAAGGWFGDACLRHHDASTFPDAVLVLLPRDRAQQFSRLALAVS